MNANDVDSALAWQAGIWDRMSDVYQREIDRRFAPVIEGVVSRAGLAPGSRVLDLGTGTGSIAMRALPDVGSSGEILGVDISPDMLAIARNRAAAIGAGNVRFEIGRAEELPAGDASFDAVLASLSLMFALDRDAAAREIARVLKPGGRFVAAVWSGSNPCDLLNFQRTIAGFAPAPPVAGAGPASMADQAPFVAQLAGAGIEATVDSMVVEMDFPNFEAVWTAFAGVTASQLSSELQEDAKAAIRASFYPNGDGPRALCNTAAFITGSKRS